MGNVESVVGYSYSQSVGKTNVLKMLQGYQCVTCGSNMESGKRRPTSNLVHFDGFFVSVLFLIFFSFCCLDAP
jgi:hypothetical protein